MAVLDAIQAICDVIASNRKLSDSMKVLLMILAVLFSIMPAIVGYFIGRNAKSDLFGRKSSLFR